MKDIVKVNKNQRKVKVMCSMNEWVWDVLTENYKLKVKVKLTKIKV